MRLPVACAVAAFVATAVRATPSKGQPARDPALAEQLFDSARTCLAKDDWACACPKFEASMQADPSVSTQINIAKCQEHEGKLTLAWASLQDALKLNRTIAYPDEKRRVQLGEYAQKMLDALEPRIPRLRIVLASRPEGLQVTRDGNVIPVAALDEPLLVDPGDHELVVDAPGFETERRTMKLAEGSIEMIEVRLTKSIDEMPSRDAAAPKGQADVAGAPPLKDSPAPPSPPPADVRRTAGWVFFGAGAVGLVAAGALGVVTLSKSNAADSSDACTSATDNDRITACNTQRDAARGFQTASIVTAVASGVVAAGGVVLIATSSRSSSTSGALAPHWSLVALPGCASLRARF